MVERTGVSRTNYEQMVPVRSKEWVMYQEEYNSLRIGLQEFFDWMAAEVCTLSSGQ